MAFSPDGKALASSVDGELMLRNPETDERQTIEIRPATGLSGEIAWSPRGRSVAIAGESGTATIIDVHTGGSVRLKLHHDKGVSSVAYSPDGALIATGSWDRTAKLWDAVTGENVTTFGENLTLFRGHGGAVLDVAFSPDGKTFATAHASGTVKLWDVPERK